MIYIIYAFDCKECNDIEIVPSRFEILPPIGRIEYFMLHVLRVYCAVLPLDTYYNEPLWWCLYAAWWYPYREATCSMHVCCFLCMHASHIYRTLTRCSRLHAHNGTRGVYGKSDNRAFARCARTSYAHARGAWRVAASFCCGDFERSARMLATGASRRYDVSLHVRSLALRAAFIVSYYL